MEPRIWSTRAISSVLCAIETFDRDRPKPNNQPCPTQLGVDVEGLLILLREPEHFKSKCGW
jgi:hypothetical protein